MNLHRSPAEGRRVATRRRRAAAPRLRPGLEGLEDRTVMSTATPGFYHSGHLTLPLPPAHPTAIVAPAATPVHAGPQVQAAAVAAHHSVHAKPAATPAATQILTLNLPPIDLNLLGLEVQTSRIIVNVSARSGSGQLLGNLLTDVSNLLNLRSVNAALDNVLGNVVGLLNRSTLAVTGVNTSGSLGSTTSRATVPVLNVYVAPVHLNLLGAVVDTSAIHLTITAHTGPGLILGDVVGDLAHLFDPPLPSKLSLDYIDGKLGTLLTELNRQIPGFGTAAIRSAATTTAATNDRNILALTVPPIDLDLLGLILKTSKIQVNADAISGSGNLLGNVLTDLLNTVGATPRNIGTLNHDVNAILSKLIGVLNAATLTLPANATSTLSQALQTLSLPNLVNSNATATAPILNLIIASPNGTAPPVNVNLLGLKITTSDIQAQLLARTGHGKLLGNLLYNVSHLLDPGGSTSLLSLLNVLGL